MQSEQENQTVDIHGLNDLERRVCKGLRPGEFHPVFQGVYHVGTGKLSRIEAQVRWAHPEYGLLLHGAFMMSLDRLQVACEMTRCVVESVCDELGDCLREGLEPCPIAISVPPSIVVSEDFAQEIVDVARSHGVAPNLIEIELTESEDAARILSIRTLTSRFRELGVGISLGDFGNRHSSLALLSALDVDPVKLARELLGAVPGDRRSCTVVSAVLGLLDALNIRVVVKALST